MGGYRFCTRTCARRLYGRQYRIANRDKWLARKKVEKAVKNGSLIRQPCEVCGGRSQAHHSDYSKPLEAQWLCQKHHREADILLEGERLKYLKSTPEAFKPVEAPLAR